MQPGISGVSSHFDNGGLGAAVRLLRTWMPLSSQAELKTPVQLKMQESIQHVHIHIYVSALMCVYAYIYIYIYM